MGIYLDSDYGIILILWGLVFELGGLLMGVLAYRAIQHDPQHANQSVAEMLHQQGPPAEPVAPDSAGLRCVA